MLNICSNDRASIFIFHSRIKYRVKCSILHYIYNKKENKSELIGIKIKLFRLKLR